MALILATHNPGKLREIRAVLAPLHLSLLSPAELGLQLTVPEEGLTYRENAARKALAYAQASGLPALADDSGLEVDALQGAPGVRSARLAPWPGATDADRRRLLLARLQAHPRPWHACFRCVVAVATPDGNVRFAEGICRGEIIPQERGQQGFGYDPIFLLPALGRTMAELSPQEKNRLSHRGQALRATFPWITELPGVR